MGPELEEPLAEPRQEQTRQTAPQVAKDTGTGSNGSSLRSVGTPGWHPAAPCASGTPGMCCGSSHQAAPGGVIEFTLLDLAHYPVKILAFQTIHNCFSYGNWGVQTTLPTLPSPLPTSGVPGCQAHNQYLLQSWVIGGSPQGLSSPCCSSVLPGHLWVALDEVPHGMVQGDAGDLTMAGASLLPS